MGWILHIRVVVLQNRYVLDVLSAVKQGICRVVENECCSYIVKYAPAINDTIHKMKDMTVKKDTLDISLGWDSIWFWLPGRGWLCILFMYVIIIIVLLVFLCCYIQCIQFLLNVFKDYASFLQKTTPTYNDTE